MENIVNQRKLKFWKAQDFNGVVFVFLGNVGNYVILITTLLGFGWSQDLIFNKVVPGMSIGLFLGNGYYAYMAYKLSKKNGWSEVTALPAGISTPCMFIYLFSIIAPLQFGMGFSPEETWKYAIAACFIGGIIEASGGFLGPVIRKKIPRVAMLAAVAGVSLVWLATKGFFTVYSDPIIGMPVLMIVLLGLIGGYRLPKNIPPILVAFVFGLIMSFALGEAHIVLDNIGQLTTPKPYILTLASGLKTVLPFLAAILPVEIYNFIDTMDNVESAIVAGDEYSVKEAQIVDGIATAIGAIFGSTFPNTVWIGHPGLKRAGCGIGYSIVVSLLFLICGLFGVFHFIFYLMPPVVITVLFLYTAMVAVTQTFADSPKRYGAAIVVALVPHLADVLFTQTTGVFNLLGAEFTQLTLSGLDAAGGMWNGVAVLKPGALLTSMIWASLVVFVIDRKLSKAAICCLLGAVLTFFGVLHGTTLGWNVGEYSLIFGYLGAMVVLLLAFFTTGKGLDVDKSYEYV